jgi:hypothetical protein
MLSGMVPRMLRQHVLNDVLRRRQSTRTAQRTSARIARDSRRHSHVAIARSTTSRARHARPGVVTRITACGVVLPARPGAPRAAVGGDVQLHECSPLARGSGGHDTHSDTPLDRRGHVPDKSPSNMGDRTRQRRILSDAFGAVVVRAARRVVRQRAAPAEREREERERERERRSSDARRFAVQFNCLKGRPVTNVRTAAMRRRPVVQCVSYTIATHSEHATLTSSCRKPTSITQRHQSAVR